MLFQFREPEFQEKKETYGPPETTGGGGGGGAVSSGMGVAGATGVGETTTTASGPGLLEMAKPSEFRLKAMKQKK